MRKNSENNQERTWKNLGCNHSFLASLCFSSRQSLKKSPFLKHHLLCKYISPKIKNPNLFQKKKENPPFFFFLFFIFAIFFFFFFMYLCQPPKTQSTEGNLLSFILFPFLFENQNVSFFLCRISSFHMYAATLILFSLQKYFSYLLRVHVP